MSDAALQAVFCGECGCLVEGPACSEHPEAVLTNDDPEQVYIVPGIPWDDKDDLETQAAKRLIYARCDLNLQAAWAQDNGLAVLAVLFDRQARELFEVIETINPALAAILVNVDAPKLIS